MPVRCERKRKKRKRMGRRRERGREGEGRKERDQMGTRTVKHRLDSYQGLQGLPNLRLASLWENGPMIIFPGSDLDAESFHTLLKRSLIKSHIL